MKKRSPPRRKNTCHVFKIQVIFPLLFICSDFYKILFHQNTHCLCQPVTDMAPGGHIFNPAALDVSLIGRNWSLSNDLSLPLTPIALPSTLAFQHSSRHLHFSSFNLLPHLSCPSKAFWRSLMLSNTTTKGQRGSPLPSNPYWVLFNLFV